MLSPVPTACTLKCDCCNREFNAGTRHVFKTAAQACLLADKRGWFIGRNGYALCPVCRTTSTSLQ